MSNLTTLLSLSEVASLTSNDVLSDFLKLKISTNTRQTYSKALDDFFIRTIGVAASPTMVGEFLSLSQTQAVSLVLQYQAKLMDSGLTPSTINVRLSALKSLVNHARKVGRCEFTLVDVRSRQVEVYRDTSGLPPEGISQILATCNQNTLKGVRDYAVLRLLWGNALRRGEVSSATVGDYSSGDATLMIMGKGKVQKSSIDLPPKTILAIDNWLEWRSREFSSPSKSEPLFVGLTHGGGKFGGEGIRSMLVERTEKAGISKQMSPHRIRHSAITAALDASGGDVRSARALSRHANLNTLTRYDDNRHKLQGKASLALDDLV